MRVSIKGVLSIPKEVWSTKAHMHRGFSESLSLLLSADESGPLVDALREMIDKNKRLADVCDEIRKETRKGRPTKKNAIKTNNALIAILCPDSFELRRRPGKPTQYGPKYDKLTFKVVEERRQELAQKKSKPTIKAAIYSLNAQLARDNSKPDSTYYLRKEFARVHSAYQRGKKLSGA